MASNDRPEWITSKWGMFLGLPYSERNKDFLTDMKGAVPQEERKWDNDKKQWWISDAYLDEVDQLLFHYFEVEGYGRDD